MVMLYDSFNFDTERGRDQATLGDAFTMEVCNRYPEELKRKSNLNTEIVNNLRHITNVRPALATPLWITGQIKRLASENMLKDVNESELKRVWDDLAEKFLDLEFVKSKDRPFQFDVVDKMQAAIKISKLISFETLDKLIFRIQKRRVSSDTFVCRKCLEGTGIHRQFRTLYHLWTHASPRNRPPRFR